MCVIAVSPKGVGWPTEANFKDMFESNDDGAGIAYTLNKRVYIEKGFMTYTDFSRAVALVEKKIKSFGKTKEEVPIMFHFRIGTHGPNAPELTHPFPISSKKEHLMALDLYADFAVAHNGIIHSVTPVSGWSDTQQYIADVLVPLIRHDGMFMKSPFIQDLIKNTISGSRFVFLDKHGEFTLIGDWKTSDEPDLEGIKYSNLNHEYTPTSYGYGYGYSYGYSNGYHSYKNSDFYVQREIEVAPIPAGTTLYADKDMDNDFRPHRYAKPTTVTDTTKAKYYIDSMGDILVNLGDDILIKSYLVDYAIMYDPKHKVYYYHTSDTIGTEKVRMMVSISKSTLKKAGEEDYDNEGESCKVCV